MTALLNAHEVSVHFPLGGSLLGPKLILQAVHNVSFKINPGETLALVGESGSGKTTIGHAVAGLRKPTMGHVEFRGEAVRYAGEKPIQVVFQDPFSALDPRMLVGDIVSEPLKIKGKISKSERWARASHMLTQVNLPAKSVSRYSHQFSGGERQRIAIARALISDPELIVADEPLSALDVSVQSQVLNLMKEIQQKRQIAYLFISHDLGVVNHLADRVAVLYLGRIMELANREDLFTRASHPYTRALLSALPRVGRGRRKPGLSTQGEIPSPLNPPSGCVFHTRCPMVQSICKTQTPALLPVGQQSQLSACHFRGSTA
jgi:oligopeptide/dipeptide ABC transporter ATP-binding protein